MRRALAVSLEARIAGRELHSVVSLDRHIYLPVSLGDRPWLGQRAAGKVILVDDLTGTGQERFEVGASGGEASAPLKKS